MTGQDRSQDRPQDPVPPEYQDQGTSQDTAPPTTASQHTGGPAFQAYQPYPQGYAPYQPGYPPHPYYAPQGPPPPNHIGWAIAAILLFWPVGIAAIIKSTQVDRYWMTGQYALAEQSSKSARTLGIVSLIVAGALFLLWFVIFFLMVGTFVDQIPQIPAPPR